MNSDERTTEAIAGTAAKRSRKKLSKPLLLSIYRRDSWLCCCCNPNKLTADERRWLKALKADHFVPIARYSEMVKV